MSSFTKSPFSPRSESANTSEHRAVCWWSPSCGHGSSGPGPLVHSHGIFYTQSTVFLRDGNPLNYSMVIQRANLPLVGISTRRYSYTQRGTAPWSDPRIASGQLCLIPRLAACEKSSLILRTANLLAQLEIKHCSRTCHYPCLLRVNPPIWRHKRFLWWHAKP